MNSFKGKLYISDNPFNWPSGDMFAGLENYTEGIRKTGFFAAFGWSAFITVGSVLVIVLFTSMTAWYITRVKTRLSNTLYYLFVFSMVVPFQMVMFTMSKLADMLKLNNPVGMIFLYLGFGAGTSRIYVLRFCKEYSCRDRGSSHDRLMYADPDIFPDRDADPEANSHYCGNLKCHVGMERLPASVSGDRSFYTIQDHSGCSSVSDGILWCKRLWFHDGTSGACDHPDHRILFILPEIYHRRCCGRCSKRLNKSKGGTVLCVQVEF